MSPEHVDHFLLWLLEKTGKLDADSFCKFVEMGILFLDELDQLADLPLEIVQTLAN